MARVSIVMPSYNSRDYICTALDSCLAQTTPAHEIIVVDDGSTDDTRTLVQRRYGTRIRYLQQANAGPAIARNRGIEAAEGDYIKFCDADDRLYPDHLAQVIDAFQTAGARVGVVYTRHRVVDATGAPHAHQPAFTALNGAVFCEILHSNGTAILTSTVTARKQALIDVGLFPHDPTLRHAEDWDVFLRLATRYHYRALNTTLIDYRVHAANLTADKRASASGRLRVIERARTYDGRAHCLNDAAYDRLLAGRHHQVAMSAWQAGDRAQARHHLRQAQALTPQSRTLRRLYHLLTYVAPFALVDRVNRWRGA